MLGLNNVPNAGDQFQVVDNEKQAREIAEYRINKEKERKLLKQKDDSAGDLFENLGQETSKKVLNVIIKTDVGGTCEAIMASLNDLSNDLAKVKIVSSGVGGISESDANLALAVDSIILGLDAYRFFSFFLFAPFLSLSIFWLNSLDVALPIQWARSNFIDQAARGAANMNEPVTCLI